MTNQQHHNHCAHSMSYCDRCDKAYCKTCGREWGSSSLYWYYPYYTGSPTWTYTSTTPTVTWDTTNTTSTGHTHK